MGNKLIIAAAGSGKTTFLVEEALKQSRGKVLITTYTESNEREIRRKIIEINKFIPESITVQTWFSFLLQHGLKPYQGCLFNKDVTGLVLVNQQSARGVAESNVAKYYFTDSGRIYSDKLSKFVIKCNERTKGDVVDRLSRIYSHVYIDETQDLAGYDLDFLKLLFESTVDVLMVADPRQVVYLTHNERRYEKYSEGRIKDFILDECKKISCTIDEDVLNVSHRNNEAICNFSSRLFPTYKACKSSQKTVTGHDGIFGMKQNKVEEYLKKYSPIQLRLNKNTKWVDSRYEALNFGESKGLSFNRVLIYPTQDMAKWISNVSQELAPKTRAQFYVAITRARFSVAIVGDFDGSAELLKIK